MFTSGVGCITIIPEITLAVKRYVMVVFLPTGRFMLAPSVVRGGSVPSRVTNMAKKEPSGPSSGSSRSSYLPLPVSCAGLPVGRVFYLLCVCSQGGGGRSAVALVSPLVSSFPDWPAF